MNARDACDEVFYQIMPIAWRRGLRASREPELAQANAFGNFRGMIDGLEYLRELGVTSLWLNPIFPSSAYHGYQHDVPDRVNPWFGNDAEFRDFVREAHRAGIRVLVDLVAYGASNENAFLRRSYANPGSDDGRFVAYEDGRRTRTHGYCYSTWSGNPIGFAHWDLREKSVRERFIAWSRAWLIPVSGDDAIDGFRLDHVWRQYPRGPGGWGYHLEFWLEWKREMLRARADVWTCAEQAEWSSFGEDLLPAHDAVMTIPLALAARRSLLAEDPTEFVEVLNATLDHLGNPRSALGVLGNHDMDRLASAIGADVPGREGRLHAALAMLLLLPFSPCLYYGDELGMRGSRLDIGGDVNDIPVREPMRWREFPGEESSRYHLLNPIAKLHAARRNNERINVEQQRGEPGSALESARRLIRARHATPALRRGRYRSMAGAIPGVWVFLRGDGADRVLGAVNLTGKRALWRVPLAAGRTVPLDLAPYAWTVVPAPNAGVGAENQAVART